MSIKEDFEKLITSDGTILGKEDGFGGYYKLSIDYSWEGYKSGSRRADELIRELLKSLEWIADAEFAQAPGISSHVITERAKGAAAKAQAYLEDK